MNPPLRHHGEMPLYCSVKVVRNKYCTEKHHRVQLPPTIHCILYLGYSPFTQRVHCAVSILTRAIPVLVVGWYEAENSNRSFFFLHHSEYS